MKQRPKAWQLEAEVRIHWREWNSWHSAKNTGHKLSIQHARYRENRSLVVNYLSASAVVIHYTEALYQVYAPLSFTSQSSLVRIIHQGLKILRHYSSFHSPSPFPCPLPPFYPPLLHPPLLLHLPFDSPLPLPTPESTSQSPPFSNPLFLRKSFPSC